MHLTTNFLSSQSVGRVTLDQINEILELKYLDPITVQRLADIRKFGTKRLVAKYDGHIVGFGFIKFTMDIHFTTATIFNLHVHPYIQYAQDPKLRWEDVMDLMLSRLVDLAKGNSDVLPIIVMDQYSDGMCRRAQAYLRARFVRESDSVFYLPYLDK